MRTINYKTTGTCSREIQIKLNDDNTIAEVTFIGGCAGNTMGLSHLAVGLTPEEVITRLKGIKCGIKNTSCPDQLSKALEMNK